MQYYGQIWLKSIGLFDRRVKGCLGETTGGRFGPSEGRGSWYGEWRRAHASPIGRLKMLSAKTSGEDASPLSLHCHIGHVVCRFTEIIPIVDRVRRLAHSELHRLDSDHPSSSQRLHLGWMGFRKVRRTSFGVCRVHLTYLLARSSRQPESLRHRRP